jgi:hypothetical protein
MSFLKTLGITTALAAVLMSAPAAYAATAPSVIWR